MSSDQAPQLPAQPYSRAFENMVEDPDDLIGLLAYALYKQHVREEARQGAPTNGEMRNPSPISVGMFRGSAEQLLNAFAANAIDEAKPDILNSAVVAAVGEAAQSLSRHIDERTGVGTAILTNLVAWFATVVITIIVVVGLSISHVGEDLIARFADTLARPPEALTATPEALPGPPQNPVSPEAKTDIPPVLLPGEAPPAGP
jgi:hypothetical protein